MLGGDPQQAFATALLLGIAYAASIGGIATLIGTPPNAQPRRAHLATAIAALAWVAALTILTPPTLARRPQPRELLCVERGVVSFSEPDDTRFGKAAGGRFGVA